MAAEILTTEPAQFRSGSTVKWAKSLADYPASAGWTLKYALRPNINGATTKAVVSTASGDDHLVIIPAADTANYPAGQWFWFSYVESGSERYDIGQGEMTVLPNPATATGKFDGRTHAQRMLVAIRAMLEGTASREEEEYEVDTPGLGKRRLKLFARSELIQLYNFYKRERADEVAAERIANGLGSGRKILTRFTRPA